jgi:hypothetical protein
MLRILATALALSAFSTATMAHPDPHPESEAPASTESMERPELPSKSEIQNALKQMPDMNAIMGDMMGLMKDEGFRENMESSARTFGDRLERSGALESGKNGMPDFNNALAVMMETFSDEEAMGGMLDTMMGLASAMEKHAPNTAQKSIAKAAASSTGPNLQDMQKEIDSLRAEVQQLRNEKAGQ